jgi:hypothetical protein
VPANLPRPDLRELGLHSTGMAGFGIDEANYPGLSLIAELSVRATENGLLIHRRRPSAIPLKLFFFDIGADLRRTDSLAAMLGSRFALPYDELHKHPFDTLFAILNNQFAKSIMASGSLSYWRYQATLKTNQFICAALIRHPFETLALQLMRAIGSATDVSTQLRSGPAIDEMLRDTVLLQGANVVNPVTQSLACRPGETPTRAHIGVALDRLATFDLVGLRSDIRGFMDAMTEITSVEFDIPDPLAAREEPAIANLAAVLARMENVRKLLGLDIALHAHIEDALHMAKRQQQS